MNNAHHISVGGLDNRWRIEQNFLNGEACFIITFPECLVRIFFCVILVRSLDRGRGGNATSPPPPLPSPVPSSSVPEYNAQLELLAAWSKQKTTFTFHS